MAARLAPDFVEPLHIGGRCVAAIANVVEHVDDLADALFHLLRHYSEPEHVNVGTGEDVSITELAETIAAVVGYDGGFEYDTSKPDGTPRKLMDVSRLKAQGWTAKTSLKDGIAATYRWYLENQGNARGMAAE